MPLTLIFAYFFIGCCVGSFLCLCAVRLYREESLLGPRSHCDACGHTLALWELFPILSFLWLRGKCRHCGAEIPWIYCLRELETGFFFALLGIFREASVLLLIQWGILSLMLLLSWLDAKEQMLYEDLFWPLGALILFQHFWLGTSFLWAATGALVVGGVLYFFYRMFPGSAGAGDVRLVTLLGLWLGPVDGLKGLFGAVLAALAFLLLKRMKRKEAFWEPIPFAPFLCGAAFFVMLWNSGLAQPLLAFWQFPDRRMLFCLLGLHRESIGQKLHSFFHPLPRKLLTLYLDSRCITVCQVRRENDTLRLERVLQEALPMSLGEKIPEEKISALCEWLRMECGKKGITAKACAVTVAPEASTWLTLSLPVLKKEAERQEAAYWESVQKVPWEAGNYSLRLGSPLPSGQTGAIAMPQPVIAWTQKLLREMGWHPVKIQPALLSLGLWTAKKTAAWLWLEEKKTITLILYAKGEPQAVFSFARAQGKQWDGVEQSLLWDSVQQEDTALGKKILETMRQENRKRQLLAVLAYWWGSSTETLAKWQKQLQAEGIPLEKLPLSDTLQALPCYPDLKKKLSYGSAAAALGSALFMERTRQWDFQPKQPLPSWPAVIRGMEVTGAAALIFCLFGGIFQEIAYKKQQEAKNALLAMSSWYECYQEEQTLNRLLSQQVKQQQTVRNRNVDWDAWLTLLGRELPADCYLQQAAWDKENRDKKMLRLSGRTLESQAVLSFVQRLRDERAVKNVQIEKMERLDEKSETEFSLLVEMQKGNGNGTKTVDGKRQG